MSEDRGCAFGFIRLPARTEKPRSAGLTLVLDKGLTIPETREQAAFAGPYIDVVKLGWGTARLLDRRLVREKIEVYRGQGIGVCPGGTFLEIAAAQGQADEFLTEARDLGFTHIEVSDGVVSLGARKLDLIGRAVALGFQVLSEVGRKSSVEDERLDIGQRIEAIRRELAAGSWKVVIEGRESGDVGIYDATGRVKPEMVGRISEAADPSAVVWEAPQKSQQVWLIRHFGPNVNLANISPADVISVESLRVGLRGDTVRDYHVDQTAITIELGPQGALAAGARGDVIVVIDVLRASTTIVTALAHGMRAVVPTTSVEECRGEVTAGERGGKTVAGLMHDNSPVVFAHKDYRGKELVLTTTNGTECIKAAAAGRGLVLIGALVNARAVAAQAYRLARETNRNITLLVAGRNNKMAVEDLLCAGEIALALPNCAVRGEIPLQQSADLLSDLLASESGANLVSLGKRADVMFCAEQNVYDVVPVWEQGRLVPLKDGTAPASP
jgi:2-phosphosulfolactate phosphatase